MTTPTQHGSAWRAEAAALPSLSPTSFDLEPHSTALLLVDVQHADASRDDGWGPALRASHPAVWSYFFDRIESVAVPNMVRLLAGFRRAGMRVIHITLGPVLPDGSDLTPVRRSTRGAVGALSVQQGTFAHSILPDLEPLAGELVINKTSRSAFNSTAIDQTLRNLGIRGLIVAGVTTSACVETTARDAADRGYLTVIVDDASAELDQASHDATLRQFAVRWGRVWTTDEALDALGL